MMGGFRADSPFLGREGVGPRSRRRGRISCRGASSSRTSSHPRARAGVARAGFARGAVVRAVGAVARADVRDRLLDPAQPPRAPRVPAAAARVAVAVVVAARGVAAAHDDGRAETGVGARAGARPRRRARAAWEMRPERIGSPDEASLNNGSAREENKTGRVGWRAARVPFSACAVQHGRPQWVARVSLRLRHFPCRSRAPPRTSPRRASPRSAVAPPSAPPAAPSSPRVPAASRRAPSPRWYVSPAGRDRTRASPENLARRSASGDVPRAPSRSPPVLPPPRAPLPLPHALRRPRRSLSRSVSSARVSSARSR